MKKVKNALKESIKNFQSKKDDNNNANTNTSVAEDYSAVIASRRSLNREFLEYEYGSQNLENLIEINVRFYMYDIDSNVFKDLSKLEKLDLSINLIEEIDRKLFADLLNLKELHLNNTKLKNIDSDAFQRLGKLELLKLNNNDITEIDKKLFAKLTNLKELFLNGNKLLSFNSNTFKSLLKLEKLMLNENEIEEINPKLLKNLSNLKELYLWGNKLEELDWNTFKNLKKLEILHLNLNKIRDIDENSFYCLFNLKELLLDNNKLKRIERKCFEPLKSIELIQLFDNDLKAISFYFPSTKLTSFYYIKDELDKNGFISDWKVFLKQFDRNANGSLIGELIKGKYRVKSSLGEGTFGKVYLVINENESMPNFNKAMKMMKKGEDWVELDKENEVNLLQRLRHENIIKYFEHFDETIFDSNYFCFVCELCENGNLREKIKKARSSKTKISELKIVQWMIEATSGLKYLHDEKIIHRDIKPANILLTKDDVIKLADFGHSKLVDASIASTPVGTRAYMSPQLIQSYLMYHGTYSKKTDIWSLACVLFELIELKLAFPSGFKLDTNSMLDLGTSRFVPILEKMLEWEEINRIDAKTLLSRLIEERNRIEDDN